MSARVVHGGVMLEKFGVNTGVKPGCVLAPVAFNILLVDVTLVFRHNISVADGIRIKYSLDGSLFNIHRLQTATEVTNDIIFDLQYTHDAALPSHTPDGLRRQLDAISSAYSPAGLHGR